MNQDILDAIKRYGANGRDVTFERAFELAESIPARVIIETGCMRVPLDTCPDGASTYLLALFAKSIGARFVSIDTSPGHIEVAKQACQNLPVEFIIGDSVVHLERFVGTIDLIYLDSFDYDFIDGGPSQKHQLREVMVALPKLSTKAVFLSDDWGLDHKGKGALAVPFLFQHGFKVVMEGYQVLMSRQ